MASRAEKDKVFGYAQEERETLRREEREESKVAQCERDAKRESVRAPHPPRRRPPASVYSDCRFGTVGTAWTIGSSLLLKRQSGITTAPPQVKLMEDAKIAAMVEEAAAKERRAAQAKRRLGRAKNRGKRERERQAVLARKRVLQSEQIQTEEREMAGEKSLAHAAAARERVEEQREEQHRLIQEKNREKLQAAEARLRAAQTEDLAAAAGAEREAELKRREVLARQERAAELLVQKAEEHKTAVAAAYEVRQRKAVEVRLRGAWRTGGRVRGASARWAGRAVPSYLEGGEGEAAGG